MKTFIKKYHLDIIVIGILLIVSLLSVFLINFSNNKNNNVASIYSENHLVYKINLEKENEERFLVIEGKNGEMTLSVSKNEIKVIKSSCPKKECIKHGKASPLKPIICAYNEVYIEINAHKDADIEIG